MKKHPALHRSLIDIPVEHRQHIVLLLNTVLACALDLKSQVKVAHWNVKGQNFLELHELFDSMAGELEAHIDIIAERITSIGGVALGTVRIAASESILPEYPVEATAGTTHLEALAKRYAQLTKLVREDIDKAIDEKDSVTSDIVLAFCALLDKRLWFIEAHYQDK